ncbi:hypothetical protein [Prevotella dentasini]|nr:hypothetical protein [Prevotella dentasini]
MAVASSPHFPDTPSLPYLPSAIIAPHEEYTPKTIHRLGTE